MIMNINDSILPASPRQAVQVRFKTGQVYEGPVGTPLEAFVRAAKFDGPAPVVAALVDGRLCELTFPVSRDVDVEPVSMENSDGMRIYQRSLTLLLTVASRAVFPEAGLMVDHAVPLGGFYCQVSGRPPFTPGELSQIDLRMRAIVRADEPIARETVPVAKAIEIFEQLGYDDKVRLLRFRKKGVVPIYSLLGHYDSFYGYMVPSTSYLQYFSLSQQGQGFILYFPTRFRATDMPQIRHFPRLISAFLEYRDWLHLLGVEDVASLNETIETGRIREVVLVCEALHEDRIARIAHRIADLKGKVRLVLIAGPSSAGKTTFTRRLAIQLVAHGIHCLYLGLDDYFVDRQMTPLNENGEYDFEALEAVDLRFFNQQLVDLMAGKSVVLPRYNFVSGRREAGPSIQIGPQHVILLEGIHGLNPGLLPSVPSDNVHRIYVSPLTQLNLDHHNRIATSDTRLLRRIARDAAQRGYTPTSTISRWESVRRGEVKNIFPYQENADSMFNSALAYELAVLKPVVEPLLRQVEPGSLEYVEARRLLSFLNWIEPCTCDLVPDNSILREFIGDSILQDYVPTIR